MHYQFAVCLGFLRIFLVCSDVQNREEWRSDPQVLAVEMKPVTDIRGFYRIQHSLIKPYQGSSMVIPYWDINGATMVTRDYIRLTPNQQSKQGGLWNNMPMFARDWEMMVTFKISGTESHLFGDGLAIWYAMERGQPGPVFGSKDYFRGLGVFIDTYSNHNGKHVHDHPYVSAMINDGTLHYDHDNDGTHTQLGGEGSGCTLYVRNKAYQTSILIRYVGDTLAIFSDTRGDGYWKLCFAVPGVTLPTGYFFGMTAATGDLSDNHDIIAVKLFEQEYSRVPHEKEPEDRSKVEPFASYVAPPRDHIDSPRPSKLGWFGTIVLLLLAIGVIVVVLGFGLVFLQKRQEVTRKRFY